jgi:hypothetical protein
MQDTSAQSCKRALLNYFGTFGIPYEMRHDGGRQFDNHFINNLLEAIGTIDTMTIAYSKEENSIVERANLETMNHLRSMTATIKDFKEWDYSLLPLVKRIMNNTYHSKLGCAPAQIRFGPEYDRDCGIFIPHVKHKNTLPITVENWLSTMRQRQSTLIDQARALLRDHEDNHMKDAKEATTSFPLGSLVLVSYPSSRMGNLPKSKFMPIRSGPMKVIAIDGSTYTVANLIDGETDIVHISRLKSYIVDEVMQQETPLEVAMTDSHEFLVDYIVDHEPKQHRNIKYRDLKFLVKWVGYSDEHNEWRPWSDDNGRGSGLRSNTKVHEYLHKVGLSRLIPKEYKSFDTS